jgi:hypothetical protein
MYLSLIHIYSDEALYFLEKGQGIKLVFVVLNPYFGDDEQAC